MLTIGSKSCLSSIALYMMSFYKLPVGVRKRMDYYRSRLLWQEDQGIRRYHLVNWPMVCTPKDQGGLRMLDLNIMNIDMRGNWI